MGFPPFISLLIPLPLPLLLVLMLIRKSLLRSTQDPSLPPGPKPLPIIGNLHNLLGEPTHHALHRLARTHGPLMRLRLGQVDVVVASSPETAREILKAHDINFSNRPALTVAKTVTYGGTDIALSPYGDYWRQLRKISTIELLSTKRVKSFYSLRQEVILKLVSDIVAASTEENTAVNLSSMVANMANTIVAVCAFGRRCVHSPTLVSALRATAELGAGFCLADFFPNLKYVDAVTGLRFRAGRIHCKIDRILEQIMKEHRMKRSRKEPAAGEDKDLLDVLLRIKDSGELEVPLTDDNIKALVMDLFAGGTETTAITIEWAMAELMKHPNYMEKVQNELRQALKEKTKIDDDDLRDLAYLKLVIKETMRLHPPLPFLIPRQAARTCRVLGYKVNAGTRVLVNAWAIGRDPGSWKDPESFDPERFRGSSIDFGGLNFEFLPFGAGRRICPGIAFGLAGVEVALAHLLFYFNWELPTGMEAGELDMTERFGVTVCRDSPLCLVATPFVPVRV